MKLAAQIFVAFILFQVAVSLVVAKTATSALDHYLGDASSKITAALAR